jgi:hypothetical protein
MLLFVLVFQTDLQIQQLAMRIRDVDIVAKRLLGHDYELSGKDVAPSIEVLALGLTDSVEMKLGDRSRPSDQCCSCLPHGHLFSFDCEDIACHGRYK